MYSGLCKETNYANMKQPTFTAPKNQIIQKNANKNDVQAAFNKIQEGWEKFKDF